MLRLISKSYNHNIELRLRNYSIRIKFLSIYLLYYKLNNDIKNINK